MIPWLCSDESHAVAIKQSNQINIASRTQGSRLVATLSLALAKWACSNSFDSRTRESTSWFALQSLAKLSMLLTTRMKSISAQTDAHNAMHESLQGLFRIALMVSKIQPTTLYHRRAAISICRCFVTYVSLPLSSSLKLHYMMAKLLAVLSMLGLQSNDIAQEASNVLGSKIKGILKDAALRSRLPKPFIRSCQHFLNACQPGAADALTTGYDFATSETSSDEHDPELDGLTEEVEKLTKTRDVSLFDRPPKRPRLEDTESSKESLLNRLCSLLGTWQPQDLKGLSKAAPDLFADMNAEQQKDVIVTLKAIPCAGAQITDCKQKMDFSISHCSSCSGSRRVSNGRERKSAWESDQQDGFIQVLSGLINTPSVQASRKLKALSMAAAQRFAAHLDCPVLLNLQRSEIGKWCLQSLKSSCRGVRIAAGEATISFLGSDIHSDEHTCQNNRVCAMNMLRTLSRSSDIRILETLIPTLGGVACACGNEEMNLILIQLVEFLGHTNSLICALANTELKKLADRLQLSVEELLRPFWRTVAIVAVKDLPNKPQKAQQLSDLLGWNVEHLLFATQQDTLPYLILWRRLDLVQRITDTVDTVNSSWTLCMQPRNLSRILALLMSHDVKSILTVLSGCFSPITSLKDEEIVGILKMDPVGVAFEILKSAGDHEGHEREKVCDLAISQTRALSSDFVQVIQAFKEYTSLIERRLHSTRTSTTQTRMLSLFFENHALGIMNLFSEQIDQPTKTSIEKKRSLRGLETMVSLAGSNISIALPQVSIPKL